MKKTKKLMTYVSVLVFFAFIWDVSEANALASNFTGPVGELFWITVAGSIVVGGFVFILMIYFIYKYRESTSTPRNHVASEAKYEKIWLVVAIVLIVILVVISTPVLYQFDAPSQTQGAVVINVTAHRFGWNVTIPAQIVNSFNQSRVTGDFETTVGASVPLSHNITLQTGRLYELNITSVDVDHSFFAPNLDIKLDAIPGQYNNMFFSIVDAGTYLVTCAEYCGTFHYSMQFYIIAVKA